MLPFAVAEMETPTTMRTSGIILWLILGCLALGGLAAQWLSTASGIGVSPDSLGYMGTACSLREGQGFAIPWGGGQPMTHWPPLFPAVLAGVGCTSFQSLDAGAWLNGALLAANIFLLGMIMYSATRKRWCAILAAFLMVASADLLSVHAWIWSEPAFIFFCLLFLYLIHQYLERGTMPMLLAAAAAAGLAMLTRYAGAALLGTGVLAICLLGTKPLPRKLRDCLIFAAASGAPLAVWLIRNSLVGGTATNRALCWHPITRDQLADAFKTVSGWIVPRESPSLLTGMVAIAIIIVITLTVPMLMTKRRRAALERLQVKWKWPCLLSIFAASYVVFLVVSVSILDAGMPFDARILAPAYPACVAFAVCLAGLLWEVKRPAGIIVLVLLAAVAVRSSVTACRWTNERSGDGCGYTAAAWQNSPLTEYLRGLKPGSPVYTNVPGFVFFSLGNRNCHKLPFAIELTEARRNADFGSELKAMWQDLRRRDGVIAYYYIGEMQGLPPGRELRQMLRLRSWPSILGRRFTRRTANEHSASGQGWVVVDFSALTV